MSRLVFQDWPPHVDWTDHEFPAALNVADLACGTGTLLMAVAAEVERRHTMAGGANAAELHKAMVEQALHRYDVQLSAVHFAATSLAMLNPHIQFDRMNLYVMPLGAEGSNLSLGSLDFLGTDEMDRKPILVQCFWQTMQTPRCEQSDSCPAERSGRLRRTALSTVRSPTLLGIRSPSRW